MIDWDGLVFVTETVLGGNVEIEGDWGYGGWRFVAERNPPRCAVGNRLGMN